MTDQHSLTLYGIPNCDTVKKARAWLNEQGQAHTFHDYKKQGVPQAALAQWMKTLGWERLLNRQGTTWRKLPPERQDEVHDAATVLALMLEQPSVIRRPVVVRGGEVRVGFDRDDWARWLA